MRLIDADKLDVYEMRFRSALELQDYLDAQETIYLVRCDECKYRDPEDRKCDCGHGILWQLPRDDNWFCADGKRRDEDETLER